MKSEIVTSDDAIKALKAKEDFKLQKQKVKVEKAVMRKEKKNTQKQKRKGGKRKAAVTVKKNEQKRRVRKKLAKPISSESEDSICENVLGVNTSESEMI